MHVVKNVRTLADFMRDGELFIEAGKGFLFPPLLAYFYINSAYGKYNILYYINY
jgi:hypothetical protein